MIDSSGQTIQLGKEIGKGGEGSVFEIVGATTLAAKIFHQKPLLEDRVTKLEAMVGCWSQELGSVSAWPRSLLYDERSRKPCGILMPMINDARQLHELYGTTNRRLHFPEVQWHHLLLAARNAAAVFDTLHTAGIVIGDVNQGNLLVDQRMCVRLIDCDSFQITSNGETLHCPVGTPHFTPPELQSTKLRKVVRTEDHDGFGLAVLIFHLLFVGRHPFAGRFQGAGDLPIEKAIAERRFAFSENTEATRVDPPPASLQLRDLPAGLARLFELAFRVDPSKGGSRPAPRLWVEQIDLLIKQRRDCRFDPAHVFYSRLNDCPWCRIEDEGGASFFVLAGGSSSFSQERLQALDLKLRALSEIVFPDLSPGKFAIPTIPRRKKLATMPPWGRPAVAALVLVLSGCLCLLGAVWPVSLIAGSVLSLFSGGYLLVSKASRAIRKKVAGFHASLAEITVHLSKRAYIAQVKHQQQEAEFDQELENLNVEFTHYRAEGKELQDVLRKHSNVQKDEFLRKHLIRDNVRTIPGLSFSIVSMLESFGVESALDVHKLNLTGVPNISSRTELELLQWRSQMERQFTFKPEHGVTVREVKLAGEVAVWRFKVAQARKILMAYTRIKALADIRKTELKQAFAKFDQVTSCWREIAQELREFQSSRRTLEYYINRSWSTILAVTFGVPLLGLVLYAIFR